MALFANANSARKTIKLAKMAITNSTAITAPLLIHSSALLSSLEALCYWSDDAVGRSITVKKVENGQEIVLNHNPGVNRSRN